MDPESGYKAYGRSKERKNVVLAIVVVVLAMSVALSGWLIVSALNQLYADPFEQEREYAVTGTMLVDGIEVDCTGKVTTHYSSESELYRVFTYHATCSADGVQRILKFSLLFDSDKHPADLYEYLGHKGDYDLWKGTDNGVESIYYLDSDSIVHAIDFAHAGDRLHAGLIE